ncbi:hypothetical protein PG987_007415 [Apiospora arundinis]
MPKAKNNKKEKKNAKAPFGGGGGHDLPPIREVLESNHGYGTYRKESNSIATVGLDLPVLKDNNPPGSGIKGSTVESKTSTTADKMTYK